jgi:Amt family ammonium transporter
VIKMVYGLRVTEPEEDAGLDIAEHGMYGYPEQFIPQGEFPGAPTSPSAAASAATAVKPAPSKA